MLHFEELQGDTEEQDDARKHQGVREEPVTYRDFIERNECPHCGVILKDTLGAARNQGFCSYEKYEDARNDRSGKSVDVSASYQTIKAQIDHDHRELKEIYRQDYDDLMLELDQHTAVSDRRTVSEIEETLRARVKKAA